MADSAYQSANEGGEIRAAMPVIVDVTGEMIEVNTSSERPANTTTTDESPFGSAATPNAQAQDPRRRSERTGAQDEQLAQISQEQVHRAQFQDGVQRVRMPSPTIDDLMNDIFDEEARGRGASLGRPENPPVVGRMVMDLTGHREELSPIVPARPPGLKNTFNKNQLHQTRLQDTQ